MKWIAIAAVFSLGSFAQAQTCEAECAETINQCRDVCKTTLKKEAPDKVPFCQQKCKEFEDVCKKECDEQKKKRNH